jgi:hypothetical protein
LNLPSRVACALLTLISSGFCLCQAQTPALVEAQTPAPPIEIKPLASARPANTLALYQALRRITPSGEAFNIEGATLKRDAGELTLHKGTVYLYPAVNGHVTGAVFLGAGTFHMMPPTPAEQKSLSRLTKSNEMTQDFSTVVLRFTDDTAAELKKGSTAAGAHNGTADAAAATLVKGFRKEIHFNLDSRILQDVLSDKPGGMFLASFKGAGMFGKNILYVLDPEGAPGASPDQVELATYDEERFEMWAAFNPSTPAEPRLRGAQVHITNQALDIGIEKSGKLTGSAVTTFTALHDAVRVVPLNLFPKLRVSGVYGPTGIPLDYIQEGPEDDPKFAAVLTEPLAQGKDISIRTDYAGTDAVLPEGGGNYYPNGMARESWYPNGYEGLGSFANFHMTFHVPKGIVVVATGQRVSVDEKGPLAVSVWQTDDPIAVAGFNLGSFAELDSKTSTGFEVDAYANKNPLDAAYQMTQFGGLGILDTTPALKRAVTEGDAAVEIYSNFFGPLPYDHVALTQQSACNYGQSWPMLVFLPVCYFFDSSVRNRLGLMNRDADYWTTVTPHEVSHQWWGQTVGFASYRDQWMSEGFANFSASLYLLYTDPKMDSYREFWAEQKKRILEKNQMGVRPIDVGPVTMGLRLNNEKAGQDIYTKLVYAKGPTSCICWR